MFTKTSFDFEALPRAIMCVVAFFSVAFIAYSLAFHETQGLVVASFWLGCFTSLLVGKES